MSLACIVNSRVKKQEPVDVVKEMSKLHLLKMDAMNGTASSTSRALVLDTMYRRILLNAMPRNTSRIPLRQRITARAAWDAELVRRCVPDGGACDEQTRAEIETLIMHDIPMSKAQLIESDTRCERVEMQRKALVYNMRVQDPEPGSASAPSVGEAAPTSESGDFGAELAQINAWYGNEEIDVVFLTSLFERISL